MHQLISVSGQIVVFIKYRRRNDGSNLKVPPPNISPRAILSHGVIVAHQLRQETTGDLESYEKLALDTIILQAKASC